uniref:Uncharacterized protein n=1 Tax=Oryza glumipatula TaxID=40148 RepID=A0A0E0A7R3_9ORYZ
MTPDRTALGSSDNISCCNCSSVLNLSCTLANICSLIASGSRFMLTNSDTRCTMSLILKVLEVSRTTRSP